MKKLIALCIVSIVVSSVTGCGCVRRLRDIVCRGSRCNLGSAVAAPAPVMMAPPVAMAPMAMDPGCGYGGISGYDPGCGYSGAQTYGYGSVPSYDSGWMPGGDNCESCSGGYSMPSYGGGYPMEGGYLPGTTVDPGPATIEGS